MKVTYFPTPQSNRVGERVLATALEEGEYGIHQDIWWYKRIDGVLYRKIPKTPWKDWSVSFFHEFAKECKSIYVEIVEYLE